MKLTANVMIPHPNIHIIVFSLFFIKIAPFCGVSYIFDTILQQKGTFFKLMIVTIAVTFVTISELLHFLAVVKSNSEVYEHYEAHTAGERCTDDVIVIF